ncbi:hypothetical protein, partial [Candidatus Magnetaquicoccus inordinatus]|uniref:hypothetical protein n=1 Tax=Candidatus Magnetaquicoccus inordinatus TaxID=2496818 RepID=UPI001D0E554E
RRVTGIHAPIYAPPYLVYLALKSNGRNPGVTLQQLRLAAADFMSSAPPARHRTNSTLTFEGGSGRYTDEDVPAEADLVFRRAELAFSDTPSVEPSMPRISAMAW